MLGTIIPEYHYLLINVHVESYSYNSYCILARVLYNTKYALHTIISKGCIFPHCNTINYVFSADLYEFHINGKRHQIQLQRYQKRKDEAMRSVYVKGFPPSTQEHELLTYFSMFGPVGKIVYDEKKSMKTVIWSCWYC